MTARDIAMLTVGTDLGALIIVVLDVVMRGRRGRGDTTWGGKRPQIDSPGSGVAEYTRSSLTRPAPLQRADGASPTEW